MNASIVVQPPKVQELAGATRVTFELATPDGPFELYYHITGARVAGDATAAVAVALIPAMRQGWSIQSESPISAQVSEALPTIQDIFHSWDRRHRRVEVRAPLSSAPQQLAAARGAGVLFSGGLDSSYTLLKHIRSIDRLIFVTGFDVPLENAVLQAKVLGRLRTASSRLGIPLIEVETNLRQFTDRYVHWLLGHGAALASVALLLAPTIATLYVPASDTYANLVPCGSHPLLDPLWSTESLRLIHDGCEATRLEKAQRIAESDTLLQTLRVCHKNPGSAYNCGCCEKCLRTMVNLHVVGALDRCSTFDAPLDARRIAQIRVGGDLDIIAYWQENLAGVRRRGSDPALERAIGAMLRPPSALRRLFRRIRHSNLVQRQLSRAV